MTYDEFEAEYRRVVEMLRGDRSGLTAAVERLRELAAGIEDESDRDEAGWDIVALEDAVASSTEPPSEIMLQARAAYAEADRNDGTAAERLARAEEGVRALSHLAAAASPQEQAAIGALTESLEMLIGALQPNVR
jgi:hypothetical protein